MGKGTTKAPKLGKLKGYSDVKQSISFRWDVSGKKGTLEVKHNKAFGCDIAYIDWSRIDSFHMSTHVLHGTLTLKHKGSDEVTKFDGKTDQIQELHENLRRAVADLHSAGAVDGGAGGADGAGGDARDGGVLPKLGKLKGYSDIKQSVSFRWNVTGKHVTLEVKHNRAFGRDVMYIDWSRVEKFQMSTHILHGALTISIKGGDELKFEGKKDQIEELHANLKRVVDEYHSGVVKGLGPQPSAPPHEEPR